MAHRRSPGAGRPPPAARRVRDLLTEVGLESHPKLTGGAGVHVVVPLEPAADWEQAKAFCKAVATRLARAEPSRYVATMCKARRRRRIFVDYLRNGRGATSIAPYSARARAGAPVAVPIRWRDLGRMKSSAAYTVGSLPQRLARLRSDPWAEFAATRQRLTPAIIAAMTGRTDARRAGVRPRRHFSVPPAASADATGTP